MRVSIESPFRTNVRPPERRAPSFGKVLLLLVGGLFFASVGASAAIAFSTPKFVHSTEDRTKSSLQALHAGAAGWRVNNGNECPTTQRLKDEKELAASFDVRDAWGEPYEIRCDDESTTAISSGPDREKGTADDVVFPARDGR
ncbi:MAG TPA: hypothetical protein VH054_25060 [Polyangiaceae bacterium]|nr:hypothetical protein [Polyangiaceae bacterium]